MSVLWQQRGSADVPKSPIFQLKGATVKEG